MSEYNTFDLTSTIEKLTQPWTVEEIDREAVTDILQNLGSENGNAYHLASLFIATVATRLQDKNAKVVYMALMILDAVVKFGPKEVVNVMKDHEIMKILHKLFKKRYCKLKKEKIAAEGKEKEKNYKNLSGILVAHLFQDWYREIPETADNKHLINFYRSAIEDGIAFPDYKSRNPDTLYIVDERSSSALTQSGKKRTQGMPVFKSNQHRDNYTKYVSRQQQQSQYRLAREQQIYESQLRREAQMFEEARLLSLSQQQHQPHSQHGGANHSTGTQSSTIKKEIESANSSIALLKELMGASDTTMEILDEVASQLIKNENELSSLLVIASPSQETANTILDTTEKITAAVEEYKRLKKQREAKDVINPPPMSYVFQPPQLHPQQQPASHPVFVVNPFATAINSSAMGAPLYTNPFLTASPTTMATTTSPALPFANPFPSSSSPVQNSNSNFASPPHANYSPPNANPSAFVTNPFLVSPQSASPNTNHHSAFASSPVMSAGFNPSTTASFPSSPYSPYSPPTNPSSSPSPSADALPQPVHHNPFPNGNPYAAPTSSPISPTVNPYASHQ